MSAEVGPTQKEQTSSTHTHTYTHTQSVSNLTCNTDTGVVFKNLTRYYHGRNFYDTSAVCSINI